MDVVIVISGEVARKILDDSRELHQAFVNRRLLSRQLRNIHLQLQAFGEFDMGRQHDGAFDYFTGEGHNAPLVVRSRLASALRIPEQPPRLLDFGQFAERGLPAQSSFHFFRQFSMVAPRFAFERGS